MKKIFDYLSDDWKGINRIVVFGFGKMGRGNIDALNNSFNIVKIIDNNEALKGQIYKGIEIVSLKTFMDLGIKEKIVVVTSGNRYVSILEELENNGYKEYVDFCGFSTFCNDFFWNDRKQLFLGRLVFNVTTFCTLNCKNCTLLTPYNKRKKYFSLDQLKEDVKLTFDTVDYISNFIIVGGEPFLYKDLEEYIIFVGENYRKYIGNFQIITNGTLIVSEELLYIIKKYNMEIRISDYTKRVGYKEKLSEFCKDLERHHIDYVSYAHDEWKDLGFPEENVNMGNSTEELRRHMLKCNPICQSVSEGKLYYCNQGWAAEQSGLFELKENDYLDLEKIKHCADKKEKFRKYYFGDLEGGYFSFCKVCRGFDEGLSIPGGIQYQIGNAITL